MKNVFQSMVVAVALTAVGYSQEVAPSALRLVPTPQEAVIKNCEFLLTGATKILLDAGSASDRFAAEQINQELALMKKPPLKVERADSLSTSHVGSIFVGSPATRVGRKLLNERHGIFTPEMTAEGYFLDVDADGVVILAESDRGRFYGVMSLLQLMRRGTKSVTVPGVAVRDFPLHPMRGITDDISRGQVSTIANFKKIIRFIARYKINVYSPYLEDMIAFKKHPLIGKGRGALTAEEFKELDAYAQQYHVEIMPTLQTLGHCENLLSIPEYLGYAEYPGGRTLNVSDENIYALLDDMIGELSASYSGRYFNMGADETRDVGLGASKERVEKLGLAAVLAEHYRRVADIIRKYGKKPMIYGDILLKNPEILGMIPKDITIVDWNYDPQYQYDSPEVFVKAGFPIVVLSAVRNYRGPFIDHWNSFENIRRFSRAGYENRSVGVVVSSWNDYGGEELRELNWYGYAWGAECAWQPLKADVVKFNAAFFKDFFGTEDTDALQSVYAILSSPSNNYTWYELWRHPMLPFMPTVTPKGHSPIIMERLQSIESTMPLVLALLKRSEGTVRVNKEHLQYLSFVARLNLWFAKKVQAAQEVRELSHWAPASAKKDSVTKAIIALSEGVIRDLSQLRSDFENLWKKSNKFEGLGYLLMRYDRQKAFWQEKIDQVKRGEFWIDPEIDAQWIYHPDLKSVSKQQSRVQHAFFRKTFVVPRGARTAIVQLIGDTYVKLFVNGKELGEVYVRRSNSIHAEQKRIKTFNMLPFLTDSLNVIAAEARDYSAAGSAGLNVYGEIQRNDGSILTIASDTTWRTTATPPGTWKNTEFDDKSWNRAVVKQYPYSVDRPNFATGRASWIEQ